MKLYKRLTGGILVAAMVISMVAGCKKETVKQEIEPMEKEEVAKYSFDVIGGDDVMPLAGYYMPLSSIHSVDGNAMPDYLTDEYFQMIADCGVNLITYPTVDYAAAPSVVKKSLDLAEKYGIGMTVLDTRVTGIRGNGINSDLKLDEAVEAMSDYMTHPAFAGMFMYDEPVTNYYGVPDGDHVLSSYAQISKVLNKEIGVWSYQNLVGIWDMNQTEAFDQYLTEFCETQNPNNLIFDVYPFDESVRNKHDVFLYNLATYREFGEKYNIPWWSFIQAGSQWNDAQNYFESQTPYYPNEGEFDWNVNLNLAFGAKGLNYFPLFQPYYFAYGKEEGVYDFNRNGLIGTWGNKNQWYYYAQRINKHIAVIDEVLMNSVNKGILATGEKSKAQTRYTRDALLKGSSFRELADVEGDALIGCFNYEGKTALYVVNYSYEYAQDITLRFVSDYKVKVVQNAETSYKEGNGLTLNMPAGDGVLIVFE